MGKIPTAVLLSPSFKKVVFYAKVIKYFPNGLIDKVLNGLWLMIEGGYRRQNVGAHVGGHGHESEMPLMERRFSYDKNQLPLFFKRHIRGPYKEVVRIGIGNPG